MFQTDKGLTVHLNSLIESCKPTKKRGRPSHKRQIQEIRDEKKINLQTAESVVVAVNLKSILTFENLLTLSVSDQNLLVALLPEFDQISDEPGGNLRTTNSALTNEYFARFCSQYQEKLSDNKLSDDAVDQAKTDTSRELAKLDPWKLKHFEPIWGQKLISQTINDEDDDRMLDKLLHHVVVKKKVATKRPKEVLGVGKRKIKRRIID